MRTRWPIRCALIATSCVRSPGTARAQAVRVVARAHQTLIWDRQRHMLRRRGALRECFPRSAGCLRRSDRAGSGPCGPVVAGADQRCARPRAPPQGGGQGRRHPGMLRTEQLAQPPAVAVADHQDQHAARLTNKIMGRMTRLVRSRRGQPAACPARSRPRRRDHPGRWSPPDLAAHHRSRTGRRTPHRVRRRRRGGRGLAARDGPTPTFAGDAIADPSPARSRRLSRWHIGRRPRARSSIPRSPRWPPGVPVHGGHRSPVPPGLD